MNLETFRKHLQKKDKKVDEIYEELSPLIKAGDFADTRPLWLNPDLVSGRKTDGRTALVLFPSRVNLLTTTIFYDRTYFYLRNYDDQLNPINSENEFRNHFRLTPGELLQLIESGKAMPILDMDTSRYSDYMLKETLFPLVTKELPYFTFLGHALICNIWQVRYQAFPDPKQSSWGFLMDLAAAMGVGANLVRPEMRSDIWDRHSIIFDVLAFEGVARNFIGEDITLEDFFISTDIAYDSKMPISQYLKVFDHVNKDKLFLLYQSLDKQSYYDEIQKINEQVRNFARRIDQEHRYRKVLTAPVAFAFYVATETIKTLLGPVGGAIEKLTDKELEKMLESIKTKFADQFIQGWNTHSAWVKENQFPDALELAKVRHILKKGTK